MSKHNLKVVRYAVHPTYVYLKCTKCSFLYSFMRTEIYDLLVKRSDVLVVNYKEQLRLIQMCPIVNEEKIDLRLDDFDLISTKTREPIPLDEDVVIWLKSEMRKMLFEEEMRASDKKEN